MTKFLENYKIYYINLSERKDRDDIFIQQMSELGIKRYERIEALTEFDVPESTLAQGRTKGCRNVEIATSLSHLTAIKYFIENSDDEYGMFCEDDAKLDNLRKINFTITDLFNNFKGTECFQLAISTREDVSLNFNAHERTPWDFNCTVYLISREYGKKLVDTYIKNNIFVLDNFVSLSILDYRNNAYILSQPTAEWIVYGMTTTISCPLFSFNISKSSIQVSDEHHRQNVKSANDYEVRWSKSATIEYQDIISTSNKSYFSKSFLDNIIVNKKIAVVIPWRRTESRAEIFTYLTKWYCKEFPTFSIILSDSNHQIFNLSSSRNKGIIEAFEGGADIVLSSDADFFPSKDSLIKAILNSIKTEHISLPYNDYVELSYEGTKKFLEERPESINLHNRRNTNPKLKDGKTDRLWVCSGLLVITKKTFNELGGFDENYVGWGQEDIDYHKRYLDKYGRLFDYIDGIGVSLEHSREEWKTSSNDNVRYFTSKYGKDYIF